MYLHLGRDVVVMAGDVVGVFDLDTSTWSKHTKSFLSAWEKKGKVVNVSDDLPRSAVVCQTDEGTVVYISQLSTRTLVKRSESAIG
ncbi:MAG: DUF370 domain-containing protein [Ruminococcaceae bacterium]|jgi:hypothetical protein|nr:DUF370 domain-containing protein [Oscillospiraceae bacterium]